MGPPKKTRGATRKAASKSTVNMELESKRLDPVSVFQQFSMYKHLNSNKNVIKLSLLEDHRC
jgi:ABC-type polar amino acid transport system ATPase subunit